MDIRKTVTLVEELNREYGAPERYLTEKHAKKPVTVMNYPKDIKPFYMRVNDDDRTVAAMDVASPGIGEIIGGSQREERLEVLDARMAERGIDNITAGTAICAAIARYRIRASASSARSRRARVSPTCAT
jgi:aspartyl/asparaginyl-tRNA synthetase